MRVIKFRAWDKEEKVMLDWHTYKEEICDAIPIDCGDEWTERCEVMQFTGRLDKNGKEIYERDVVLPDEAGWVAEVVYHSDSFMCRDRQGGWSFMCTWSEFEVIGNIHENPELMEG